MNIILSKNPRFQDLWGSLLKNDKYQYPLYSILELSYQRSYFTNYHFSDLSFLIEENEIPILGIIISKHENDNNICEYTGFGRPIYYIENPNIENEILKGAHKKFKEIIDGYLTQSKSIRVLYVDFLLSNKLSFLGDLLLSKGAHLFTVFSRIIDLKRSESEIHQDLRKRYRGLINWGRNNLNILVKNSLTITNDDIETFRRLHIKEAGRETRNKDSWMTQLEMVKKNSAFIVFGYLKNELVTAAFFSYSPKLCYYGVGASVRALFDKPLSHAIQWTAILHAKSLGCEYFETGELLYPKQGKTLPTTKELGISTFKRGFGGDTNIRLRIELYKNTLNTVH